MQMSKFSAVFVIDWFSEGLAGGRHCALHVGFFMPFEGSIFVPGENKVFVVHNRITFVAHVQVKAGNS